MVQSILVCIWYKIKEILKGLLLLYLWRMQQHMDGLIKSGICLLDSFIGFLCALSRLEVFLTANKRDTVVNYCQITLRIVAISRVFISFFQEVKFLQDVGLESLPTDLNGYFSQHFLIVKKQWSKIDPNALRFESGPYGINIVKDVVGGV